MDVDLEMRGLRRKMKWQSGKGGSAGCGGAVIKHSPHPFAFEGFWETAPTIGSSPNSPQQQAGALLGLSRNHGPYRLFISAICYGSPTIHRLLRQPLRLNNYYYIAITSAFSPRFVFSKISSCGSGTASALCHGSSPHLGFFFS